MFALMKSPNFAPCGGVRPPLVIACMDDVTGKIQGAVETLKDRLDDDVRVELMSFGPEELERDPLLPS